MIRPFDPSDDLAALTALIHAAYAPHAERGLRYWGTHQSVEDTGKRFGWGFGFVAELGGRFVGTVTVRPPQPDSRVTLYRDPHTWTIGQYAVHPDLKGTGLGRRLHDRAVAHAQEHGGRRMALDTAAPAEALIAMYRRWGYEAVGEVDWRPHTNYISVVMARTLTAQVRRSNPDIPARASAILSASGLRHPFPAAAILCGGWYTDHLPPLNRYSADDSRQRSFAV